VVVEYVGAATWTTRSAAFVAAAGSSPAGTSGPQVGLDIRGSSGITGASSAQRWATRRSTRGRTEARAGRAPAGRRCVYHWNARALRMSGWRRLSSLEKVVVEFAS